MDSKIKMIVVIPCLAETEIWNTLKSLTGNIDYKGLVYCIIVINHAEAESEERKIVNQNLAEQLKLRAPEFNTTQFTIEAIEAFDLPNKKAGVGMARKIGMDRAIEIFEQNKTLYQGIIICLDGDCTVSANYFNEIEKYFELNSANGCSLYFEHPLDSENAKGIIEYELYLRYYINALRWCGFPNAFQTVGSSMAVKATAYIKQGGMNFRKAGEDFYFLNKIIQLGKFGDLTTTTVFPSPRKSDRVPFGTGREMMEWEVNKQLLSYSPDLFKELKIFLSLVDNFRDSKNILAPLKGQINHFIVQYLIKVEIDKKVIEIKEHTASSESFRKRFFAWMDAFQIMKLLNELSHFTFNQVPIQESANWLWATLNNSQPGAYDSKELLLKFREFDRANQKWIGKST